VNLSGTTGGLAIALPAVDYRITTRRPSWSDLPAQVRRAVADAAGCAVDQADEPPGSGFTDGFAAVVRLSDGRRVFAKAGSSANPHVTAAYAREAAVLGALSAGAPAPRLVGAGRVPGGPDAEPGWQVVVTSAADGAMPLPWTEQNVAAVHRSCLAAVAALTPAPTDLKAPALARAREPTPDVLRQIARLLRPASARVVDDVIDLVTGSPSHLDGSTACHHDLRADNILVDGEAATFVDWNWLVRGAAWTDFVGVLPLARADGVDADSWLTSSPLTSDTDPVSIDSWLCVVATEMLGSADQPVWPGGPPVVRQHRRRFGLAFLDWLAARRGWA
jgi:hypothetical protein